MLYSTSCTRPVEFLVGILDLGHRRRLSCRFARRTGRQIHRSISPHSHASTPRTVNRRDWRVGGGVEGHRSGCWRRGRPSAVCENEHNGRTGPRGWTKCLSPIQEVRPERPKMFFQMLHVVGMVCVVQTFVIASIFIRM